MESEASKDRCPSFRFYPDDFLAGTAPMSNEEVGAYMRLLCHQWSKGGLPADPDRVSRIVQGMAEPSISYVLEKFPLGADGVRRNLRLEAERAKMADFRAERSRSGARGATKRWGNGSGNGSAIAQPSESQWQNHGSPSPSPIGDGERERSVLAAVIPPLSRTEFDALAGLRGIPPKVAEWVWDTHQARGWTDSTGQIIRDVEPVLRRAKVRAEENASKDAARASAGRMAPPRTPSKPGWDPSNPDSASV